MVDSCRLDPSTCLNNGECIINISSNTSYCQCGLCHQGIFCENNVFRQNRFNTTYVFFIIYIIGFCFSLLNNSLCLELFIRCSRIRRTNCGIYLIAYCIISLLSSILLVIDKAQEYYLGRLDDNQHKIFHCYVSRIGYNVLVYLCIFFSSCIAFERGLIICFEAKMGASRWRSCAIIIVLFAIVSGSAAPMLVYKCGWSHIPDLKIARDFLIWFCITLSIAVYLVATLLVLISFARRIRRYGMENGSFMKTFLKLLHTHSFIFIPPIAYGFSQIPYTVVSSTTNTGQSYFQCGISIKEYIIKVLVDVLPDVPVVVTWLLFVYPSRVYMNEFYLNTWSGQHLANIVLLLRSYNDKESNHLSTRTLINKEYDNRESTV